MPAWLPYVAAAGASALGSIFGANKQAQAARDAANKQLDGLRMQQAFQREQADKAQNYLLGSLPTAQNYLTQYFQGAKDQLQPYANTGLEANNQLAAMMKDPSAFQGTPAYQFQLGQGTEAMRQALAASGQGIGTNSLQNLVGYGQGLANQDYYNYLNQLRSNATLGQNAAGNIAQYGMNTGLNLASNQMNTANQYGNWATGVGNQLSAATQNAYNNVADFSTQRGNAQAAGWGALGRMPMNMLQMYTMSNWGSPAKTIPQYEKFNKVD